MLGTSENNSDIPYSGSSAGEPGTDAEDLVIAALAHLRRSISTDGGTSRAPTLARQKEDLQEWAAGLGLILNPEDLPSKVVRGGQEHELFHEETTDRYFKVTRNCVFGMSPGIELALVSSDADPRRFHLWEASPIEYLERIQLQNLLTPGINSFEGVIVQGEDIAIVISQPRFDIVTVTTQEIDEWFGSLGFLKVSDSSYYRADDNLGIFDAHEKNLVRADEETLIPFDIIPCHPNGGFLEFIRETIESGHTLRTVRLVTTHSSKSIRS